LGVYDRELDTDEEEIEFEEQFILRMPEGEPSEKLREMVKEKGAKKGLEDVWFKFKGELHTERTTSFFFLSSGGQGRKEGRKERS